MRRRHNPGPIRATSMWRVDQVFLTQQASRIEVTCSLVNDRGGLRNLRLVAPTADPVRALEYAAHHVAGAGNVSSCSGARVRWTRAQLVTEQDELIRDTALETAFADAFEETLQEVRDRLR
ncbi:hypothetical protein ACFP81_11500 [Deinococcus lacus]|uniref:Uncharacterized protein n=1 Tax=Deinococcus lacus TaxID=392561 RepID=A0ABW1YB56_9DEIO